MGMSGDIVKSLCDAFAKFTRHVTGAEPPRLVGTGGLAHCFIRYRRPAGLTLAPTAAAIFDLKYNRSELVPGWDVAGRRDEVMGLGGETEITPLAALPGRYWFVGGSTGGMASLVESTDGLARLLDRGEAFRVSGGPYATRQEAENHLETTWDSDNPFE